MTGGRDPDMEGQESIYLSGPTVADEDELEGWHILCSGFSHGD